MASDNRKLQESIGYMEALDQLIAAIMGALTKNDGIDLNNIPPFVPASSPCQPGIQTSMEPSQIGKTGCFLISIMKMAEAMYGIYFDQEGIKSIYAQALKNHYIEQNCFIKNYNGVLNLMKPDNKKNYHKWGLGSKNQSNLISLPRPIKGVRNMDVRQIPLPLIEGLGAKPPGPHFIIDFMKREHILKPPADGANQHFVSVLNYKIFDSLDGAPPDLLTKRYAINSYRAFI